jgi:uncharacterized LabA/DUF88 family protein
VKWLNLRKLLEGYLSAVRTGFGERVELSSIHYFSAYATHRLPYDPGVVNRHSAYVSALRSVGVNVVLSHFKQKDVSCPSCGYGWKRYEEKEIDVAIGVKLLDALARNEGDTVVLVSGDTDLIPAIRTAKGLFPRSSIGVCFPFNRQNSDLEKTADYSFKMTQRALQSAQFPPRVALADGTIVNKPAMW